MYFGYLRGAETFYGGGRLAALGSARSVEAVKINGYTIEPGADLQGAVLERSDLTRANLEGAYLEKANLERANLERVNFAEAKIGGAHLIMANLIGADLKRADLRFTNLIAARADENTTWPDGFDPVAAGVIFE